MAARKNFWNRIFQNVEHTVTFELDDIIYSKKHGHEVCVMRLVGKNVFPIMTPKEILSSKDAMAGLSNEDLVKITRLDMEINYKKNALRLIETDRNGTTLFEDQYRKKIRYSDKLIVSSPEIQDRLNGRDGIRIGYKTGFKEGVKVNKDKQAFFKKLLRLLRIKTKV